MKVIILDLPEDSGNAFESALSKLLNKAEASTQRKDRSPLTVKEASRKLNVSASALYQRIAAGTVRTVPHLGKKLIPFSEMERLTA